MKLEKEMLHKFLLSLLALFLSFGCASLGAVEDGRVEEIPIEEEKIETIAVEKEENAEPGNGPPSIDRIDVDYLYTSELITAIYHLYGEKLDDFAVVTLTNRNDVPVKVAVETEIVGYTFISKDTVEIGPSETVEVRQNPRLNLEAVDQLNAQHPADFHIHVVYLEDGQPREIMDETAETLVYSRKEFPWALEGFEYDEILALLAAMVTPHDPAVEELIRVAADYHPNGLMTAAYKAENDEGGSVWDRLEAIWKAEDEHYDLTYINTWVSFAPGSVQRIRLPADVLKERSGNCIELALLYASAAEALDLESAIILVPGHAYVAVRTDNINANYYFIETTLIGFTDFNTAVDEGAKNFEEAFPHIEAHEIPYGWITIANAREEGILPIPWH